MFKITTFLVFIFLVVVNLFSQVDTLVTVTFDFNEHKIKEKDNKVIQKSVRITLTADGFGNERSAVYIHSHLFSYLNLGTFPLLKPIRGTVSL